MNSLHCFVCVAAPLLKHKIQRFSLIKAQLLESMEALNMRLSDMAAAHGHLVSLPTRGSCLSWFMRRALTCIVCSPNTAAEKAAYSPDDLWSMLKWTFNCNYMNVVSGMTRVWGLRETERERNGVRRVSVTLALSWHWLVSLPPGDDGIFTEHVGRGEREKLECGQGPRIPHTHAGNLCIFSMSCV